MMLAVAPCISSLLSGCAGSPVRTGWRASENRQAMVRVRPDMTVDEVSEIMGLPDKTELYRGRSDEAILVYLYITEGKDIYTRRWNESNYTPFVFVNDRLHAWGWPNLEAAAQKYEFVIKER
jgi:hypothetical protein